MLQFLMGAIDMTLELVIVGAILMVLGVMVGFMKQTWLLSGFNEKRVEEKDKLARLVGFPTLAIGLIFVNAGMLGVENPSSLFAGLVVVMIALVIYVNIKMVK